MSLLTTLMRIRRNMAMDNVLSSMGLVRRRSPAMYVAPMIGLVALGAAVGGVIGLLMAPTWGRRARQLVDNSVKRLRAKEQEVRRDLNASSEIATPSSTGL
jgi:hypothetical protein